MKYISKSKNPFKSINKQIEENAYRHAVKKYGQVKPEIFKKYKQTYIESYFRAYPIMEAKFNRMRNERKKIALLLTMGTLAVGSLGVAVYSSSSSMNKNQAIATEQQMSKSTTNEYQPQSINEEKSSNEQVNIEYDKLLEQVEKLDSEDKINYNRKQIIAESYNKVNPSNQIKAESLGIIVSTPDYLVVKKDKLGNIVETRMKATVDKENGEEKIEGKEVYQYYIDNKLVAVYDSRGTRLEDSTIQKEDKFFENTVEIVYQSERLKDVYTYQNSDADIKKCQEKYADVAMKLKDKTEKLNKDEKITLIANEENTK